MTTDSKPKTRPSSQGDGWTIGGMAKGAGMLAPGLATMLVVHHDRRRARRGAARRGAARGDPRELRPARLRRLHVDQRPGDAAGERGIRRRARRSTEFTAALTDGVPRPRAAAAGRRRGREPRHRDRGRATPRPRTTPSRSAARSRATTSSRPRSSATTPTGAGCSPRSARRAPSSTRTTSTCR